MGKDRDEFVLATDPLFPFRLGLLAIRDVARDLRRPDDPARLVPQRRDRERDVERTTALGAADCFVVLYAFTPPQAPQDLALLAETIRRHDHVDRLPDRLRRAIAEH